jgi:hypothetical protein
MIDVGQDESEVPPPVLRFPEAGRDAGGVPAIGALAFGEGWREFDRHVSLAAGDTLTWFYVERGVDDGLQILEAFRPDERVLGWDEIAASDDDPIASLAEHLVRGYSITAWRAEWARDDDPLPAAWARCTDIVALAIVLAHVAPGKLVRALERVRHGERVRDCLVWWSLYNAQESVLDREVDVVTQLLRGARDQCTCGQLTQALLLAVRECAPSLALADVAARSSRAAPPL